MIGKKFIGAMLLFALMTVGLVTALPVEILEVELDEDPLDKSGSNSIRRIDRDNEFDVKVRFKALEDLDDVQVEVALRGFDSKQTVDDISDVFDMEANETEVEKFTLKFPDKLDLDDEYRLRVRIDTKDGDTTTESYDIVISADRHMMKIKDVVFSPSNAVVAGRSLLTTVRLKNTGAADDDDGIKVSISIPELGISAADYIDDVDSDDSVTSEELYLRIPACTKAGTYDAIIEVVFDDGEELETITDFVTIVEGDLCPGDKEDTQQPKTIITVGPTTQAATQGEGGVIYPLTISNAGDSARTYVITADGFQAWADVQISPQNIVVLQPGEAKAMFVQLSANKDAPVGENMFSVTVTSGAETLKQFVLKANVVEGDAEKPAPADSRWDTIKRVLEIGLVVLVVLLVILGLIIGFSRLRGNDDDLDDDEGKSETYY